MDRPILFSGPMVRALLDGRKTQTRRVLGPQSVQVDEFKVRFAAGDRLYVREAWRTFISLDKVPPRDVWSPGQERGAGVYYEAGGNLSITKGIADRQWLFGDDERPAGAGKFRQGMHMPRWASRLTLPVTDVRMQRLQEISEADARTEGVLWVPGHGEITPAELNADPGYSNFLNCRQGYEVLWDHLNADRGFGWATNPWVVVISFTVERGNIDVLYPEAI